MKRREIYKQLFGSFTILILLLTATPHTVQAQVAQKCETTAGAGPAQCCDNIDNDKDGRADFYGTKDFPADPKCLFYTDTETETNPATSKIIPCTDKCTLESFLQLINNAISFFFKDLLIPLFVVILMYAGWRYFAAQGNSGQHAKLKKMLGNVVLGIVLMLCAWLIVHTILDAVLDSSTEVGKGALQFLQ